MKEIKVYVVGNSYGYANWIQNATLTRDMTQADLVIFTGGEDVSPSLYGEKIGKYTSFNLDRDMQEMQEYDKARALNIPMLGICRGSQFLCVMSGGRLVQHQHNTEYMHDIVTYDGKKIPITSTHHQAQYPYDMDKSAYKLIAWTENQSPVHLDGDNKEISKEPFKEAEIVFYPTINSLGIQGHPEHMWRSQGKYKETFDYLQNLVNKLITKTF